MKQKKLKSKKYVSEDTKQIQNLILITLAIVLIAVALYFITDKITKKASIKDVDFNYSVCTVGTMFNRPYEEYYVFLYRSDDENTTKYNSIVSTYEAKEDSIKIYTVNLSANLDSKYLSDSSNKNPQNPGEVKIDDSALVLIKNGKVEKYYEKLEDYEKVLN